MNFYPGELHECPVCKEATLTMAERQGVEIDLLPSVPRCLVGSRGVGQDHREVSCR
jgi:Zn-finger nucleic acid-binding protein